MAAAELTIPAWPALFQGMRNASGNIYTYDPTLGVTIWAPTATFPFAADVKPTANPTVPLSMAINALDLNGYNITMGGNTPRSAGRRA